MAIHPKVKRPVSVAAILTAVVAVAAAFGVVIPATFVAAAVTLVVAVVGYFAPGTVTE